MKPSFLAGMTSTLFICLFSSSILLANEALNAGAVNEDDVLEIVITANRKAQTIDETMAPVTVITREDIEKYQATELIDLLQKTPGINMVRNGGLGQVTSLFLRGTNSTHVLVLVDGVRVGSLTTGSFPWSNFDVSQIERIEIVRGARSSLYGSEAVGGVVQIFTRSHEEKLKPSISIGVGSQNTRTASVNISNSTANSWINLNVNKLQSEGIDARVDTANDKDGFNRDSVSLRVGTVTEDEVFAELSMNRSLGDYEYDFNADYKDEFEEQVVAGTLKVPLSRATIFEAGFGLSHDKLKGLNNDGTLSYFVDSYKRQATLSVNTQIDRHTDLKIGLDHQKDHVDSDTNYNVKSRKNTGVFANYQKKINNKSLSLSVRQDNNEQYGKYDTGALALGYEFNNGVSVVASYGRAFKAPTFNDLYSPGFFGFGVGNPSLKPEKSKNTELMITQKDSAIGDWSINIFKNKIDDLITTGAPTFNPVQVDKADINGVELSTKKRIFDWDISANATYQRAQNSSGTNDQKWLVRRPQKILNLNIDRQFGKTSVGASFHAEGKRYEDAANTEKMAGFGILDLRASYQLTKDWKLAASLNNALDKEYETVKGYNQLGRNGMVTLTYSPN
jgi:vitamin B12 transporter